MSDALEKPPFFLRWMPSTPAGHVALVLAVMVVAMAVAGYLFRHFSQQVEARTRASLETIAFSQREGLAVFLQERFLNIRLFSQRQLLQDYLDLRARGSAPPAVARDLELALQRMQKVYSYHDVMVLDPDLNVLMSLRNKGSVAEVEAPLREVVASGRLAFVDLHLAGGRPPAPRRHHRGRYRL